MPRPNAAIYYVPEGYSTAGETLMGINVASAGMLRALARHGGVERLYALCENEQSGTAFGQTIGGWVPGLATEWISTERIEKVEPVGTLMLPGPGLAAYGWMRRRVGSQAFSLCGVTHTTATPGALDAITELLVAPVEPWDALVCTSRAVRSMVSSILEEQLTYLEERFGRLSQVRPQLPIIPLGVDSGDFVFTAEDRAAARAELGVAEGEVVLLFAGRLSPTAKAHPTPLFIAAAMAAARSAAPLRLVLCGWFASPQLEAAYREDAAMICPDVALSIVDGRKAGPRRSAWAGADIFVSPVDNIQETFGLTPLEAMAAGLPVIASEWDGYRDTVRHTVDGYLARTWSPPPGQGGDLARAYGARTLPYEAYVGAASQATAIDLRDLTDAIVTLAGDPEQRGRMGAAGRERVRAEFDWSRVIAEYQNLWEDMTASRARAPWPPRRANPWPGRPDPFWAFASYPTAYLQPATRVRIGATSPQMIEVLLASPLIAFAAGTLPDAASLAGVMTAIESGATTVGRLVETHGGPDPQALWRGLAWLAKYGVINLEP